MEIDFEKMGGLVPAIIQDAVTAFGQKARHQEISSTSSASRTIAITTPYW